MVNSESKIREARQEINTWKKALEWMVGENVVLKNRLAEILKNNHVDDEFLDFVEQYQSMFIREDETLHLLRRDIVELDNLLHPGNYNEGDLLCKLFAKKKKLSREMENTMKGFSQLKFEFNNYLGEAI